ncbi:MAG TPA: hypothetical protein VMS31_03350, partial [Pyrinomonadaceae bacterium]|nr:hypothetical protein [Pyrinomonadaceae bacterium]
MECFKRNSFRAASLFIGLFAFGIASSVLPKARLANPRSLVQAAASALGGEKRLRALKSIKLETIGHVHALEQSERPEGPWINVYEQVSELRDLSVTRERRTTDRRQSQSPKWNGLTIVVSNSVAFAERGDRKFPASPQQVREAEERNALSPERILLTALDATDLRTEPDIVFLGVPHHVVCFGWGGGTVKLLLNSYNSLLDGVETSRPYPD